MVKRLLDQQVALLEYLTSGDAIFRKECNAPLPQALYGINRALLNIEARFSHEKRMTKIAAVFPIAFRLLDAQLDSIAREFVVACPPLDISRIKNACQFLGFLTARWKQKPPSPRYLPDIAACELAYAKVCSGIANETTTESCPADAAQRAIRRHPNIVLLRTAFDIRGMFEEDGAGAVPIERETSLTIVQNSGEPCIFELAPEVFDLLAALDQWVSVDEWPYADELLADLAQAGMLELRR